MTHKSDLINKLKNKEKAQSEQLVHHKPKNQIGFFKLKISMYLMVIKLFLNQLQKYHYLSNNQGLIVIVKTIPIQNHYFDIKVSLHGYWRVYMCIKSYVGMH